MIDIAVLLIAIAVPIAAWLISRNLTLVVVTLVLGIGLAGNVVQTSIALGMAWNVRGLQAFAVVVLLLVVLGAFLARGRMHPGSSMRTQLIAIVLPAVLIGVFLIGNGDARLLKGDVVHRQGEYFQAIVLRVMI